MSDSFLPCPVCPGLALDIYTLSDHQTDYTVHHCTRCSGMWLTTDVLMLLRALGAERWKGRIPFRYENFNVSCPRCQQPVSRRASHCSACQYPNVISCPRCQQALETHFISGIQQNRCPADHGFWLDHLAWTQIWDLPDQVFAQPEASSFPLPNPLNQARQLMPRALPPSDLLHKTAPRALKKQIYQQAGSAVTRNKQQGFDSELNLDHISAQTVRQGSLATIIFLGKGGLKVSLALFRSLGRLFFRLSD